MILERRCKQLATKIVHRIVDSNTTSMNSCKAQHERKCGKIKRAKDIRQESKKATDVFVAGDLNEDVNAKNIKDFFC